MAVLAVVIVGSTVAKPTLRAAFMDAAYYRRDAVFGMFEAPCRVCRGGIAHAGNVRFGRSVNPTGRRGGKGGVPCSAGNNAQLFGEQVRQ